jgi:hypothetical protein
MLLSSYLGCALKSVACRTGKPDNLTTLATARDEQHPTLTAFTHRHVTMPCSYIINASGKHMLRSLRPTGNDRNRTVPRRHGCTEKPEPPFANKAVILSTLCVWIVVSAPFLRCPGTHRLSQHRAGLHNASVDEASKLKKMRNV